MPRAVPFPYVLAWLLGVVCVVDTHFIMTFSREFAEDISVSISPACLRLGSMTCQTCLVGLS